MWRFERKRVVMLKRLSDEECVVLIVIIWKMGVR